MRQAIALTSLIALFCVSPVVGAVKPKPPVDMKKYHLMGYVVVSPNGPRDGADFGPGTPGTKTSGIQEALNFAKANKKDVYLAGGAMPRQFEAGVAYDLKETLRIPWMQNFRLDGGEAFIFYTGPKEADAIVFDSQMSCYYKFGVICGAKGAVVRFKPETKGPDNFSCVTCSTFIFNALVGGGGAWPGKDVRGQGYGLVLDTSTGSITANKIFPLEIVGCDIGLYLKPGCGANWTQSLFIHLCNTGVQLGDPGDTSSGANRIEAFIASNGIPDAVGARIFGRNNTLTLDVAESAPGKSVIFEPDSRDNLVIGVNLTPGITNNATVPTNRIITAGPLGFDAVTTPAVPKSGEPTVNRNPYTVQALILAAGEISGWNLIDANGASRTVSSKLSPGQQITLEPGDQVRFDYTKAPTWAWKAVCYGDMSRIIRRKTLKQAGAVDLKQMMNRKGGTPK